MLLTKQLNQHDSMHLPWNLIPHCASDYSLPSPLSSRDQDDPQTSRAVYEKRDMTRNHIWTNEPSSTSSEITARVLDLPNISPTASSSNLLFVSSTSATSPMEKVYVSTPCLTAASAGQNMDAYLAPQGIRQRWMQKGLMLFFRGKGSCKPLPEILYDSIYC